MASRNSRVQAEIAERLSGFRDIRREKLHRLITEIAHADAWETRKAARFGLCGEVWRLMGGLDEFFLHCDDCCMERLIWRMGGYCMNDWGFLADRSANLESSPTIHLFTFADGIAGKVPSHNASYEHHHNVIFLGPNFRYMERSIESLLTHEYVHWVLHKLFPRKSPVSEQYDNICMKVKGLRVSIGPSFLERIRKRLHFIKGRLLIMLGYLDWHLRERRHFNKVSEHVDEPQTLAHNVQR